MIYLEAMSREERRTSQASGLSQQTTPSKHRDSQLSDASRKQTMSAHDAEGHQCLVTLQNLRAYLCILSPVVTTYLPASLFRCFQLTSRHVQRGDDDLSVRYPAR